MIKRKRGRPLGWRKPRPEMPRIGSGIEFKFPIVQEGNVRKAITTLIVGAETFGEALRNAVQWSKEYSAKQNETRLDLADVFFWPVVRYKSALANEKRFVSMADNSYAYAESKDAGAWLPIQVLEAV